MSNNFDIAIIGSGIAGISASLIFDEYNLNVCIIDENDFAGGQFIKYGLDIPKDEQKPISYEKGLRKVEKFNKSNVKYFNGAELIYINNSKNIIFKNKKDELFEINPKIVILATGAREIVQPFKGWDLPGVITTGAMQILLKNAKRVFTKEIVVAGSGILPYAAASSWLDKGGEIKAFYDNNSFTNRFKMFVKALNSTEKREDLFSLLPNMLKLQMKTKNFYKVVEAKGKNSLESIVIAKLDENSKIIESSKKEIACNFLAIGEGLSANIEAGVLAGCKMEYSNNLGGTILKVDKYLQTSIENIFAIGALTGVGGADKSEIEGELCAYNILYKLEKIDNIVHKELSEELYRKREKALAFSKLLSNMQKFNFQSFLELDDTTTICRCEDIKLKQIKEAINSGFVTINSIKKRTRATMGNCQGRTCAEIIRNILFANGIDDFNPISVRPPLKPISISCLASKIKKIDANNIKWESKI